MKVFLIILLSNIVLQGSGQSNPKVSYAPGPDYWLILGKNTQTGFNYFFSTNKIWVKDSINTCQVKLNLDSAKQVKLYPKWNDLGYSYTLFNVLLDCKKNSMKILSFKHYNKNGEGIELPSDSKKLFNLEEIRESIITNVCKVKKYTQPEHNGPSPF